MIDVVDPATRSRMMASIRGRNTKPEVRLRSALHQSGLRFRLHRKDLPGRPDIVLPSRKAVVFVHGCFWHRHENCRFATTPATRSEFWQQKFQNNVERDKRTEALLLAAHWRVATIWECSLLANRVEHTTRSLIDWLNSDDKRYETSPVRASADLAPAPLKA